jgi:two-component system phosphate regulon sensor histidine kinase PhoR
LQDFWWRSLWSLLPVGLLCLILWPLVGSKIALLVFVLWLLLLLVTHLRHLRHLMRWLKSPSLESLPNASGVWEDAFAELYQELRRYNRSKTQLITALDRLQQAAGALPDGLVVLNGADQIEWCNSKAEQQLGLSLVKDEGHPIAFLIRQSEFASYLEDFNCSQPIRLRASRTPDISLELQLVPFGEYQKLLLCRDITHLEKIETMRRDFIADVSHELKTPLTVILGFLETLKDIEGAVPEGLTHYFDLMETQAGRMRTLVEDLLTLSQLESSSKLAQEQEIEMGGVLKSLLSEAQGLSAGKHRIALGEVEAGLNLYGSAEELRSAFSNLVSNAIRYTPEQGEIWMHWQLKGEEATFCVQDSGLGIEPQHISRLTERFYRVDRSRSRDTGGTGLGLSIVKHILTRHHASLVIQSKLGVGSSFSAVFPAERVRKVQ